MSTCEGEDSGCHHLCLDLLPFPPAADWRECPPAAVMRNTQPAVLPWPSNSQTSASEPAFAGHRPMTKRKERNKTAEFFLSPRGIFSVSQILSVCVYICFYIYIYISHTHTLFFTSATCHSAPGENKRFILYSESFPSSARAQSSARPCLPDILSYR